MDDEIWSRTLEHIPGISGLNKSEVRKDVKEVENLLEEYRSLSRGWKDPIKEADLDPAAPDVEETEDAVSLQRRRQQHLANLYLNKAMPTKKRSRGREVMSAEEIIETLPICRRAVRLTQSELMALKRERMDLEDNYLRLRTTFINEIELSMKEEKDQEREMLHIRKKIGQAAERLSSSKRRNTALQNILTELDEQGDTIYKFTQENTRLKQVLRYHKIESPIKAPGSAFKIGDAVLCTSTQTTGVVVAVNNESEKLTMVTSDDTAIDVQLDDADIVNDTKLEYTPEEIKTKAAYMDAAREWMTAEAALKQLVDKGVCDEDELDEDEDEEMDDGDDTKSRSDDEDDPPRKRSKNSMNGTKKNILIPFKGSRLQSVPYDMPLLVSPLGKIPGFVVAAAPKGDPVNMQWLGASLPQDLVEWENDRLEMMKMKGEIESLKFQLRQSEVLKKDAQHHVSVQLESINKLVSQLEKEREAAKQVDKSKRGPPNKKRERRDSFSESNTPSSPTKSQEDPQNGSSKDGKDDSDGDDENENTQTPQDEVVTRRTTRSKAKPESTVEKPPTKRGKKEDNGERAPPTRRASTRHNPRKQSPNGTKDHDDEPIARRSSSRV
ncbi:hypothetical protein THRCLA_00611 [Thraustotheca clavata]|uniref:Uncharacterized protein n=1 Tax=Thraustotheca clavata TaxID=74557 RepID=A0A1W0AB04_9STRA|nr:hypothetical protein THRCLA_00611 [Thraustotheca clavata]